MNQLLLILISFVSGYYLSQCMNNNKVTEGMNKDDFVIDIEKGPDGLFHGDVSNSGRMLLILPIILIIVIIVLKLSDKKRYNKEKRLYDILNDI